MLYELGRNGAGLENACRLKREDLDLFFFNLSYIFVDGFETYYKVKMKVNFVKVFY